MTRHASTIAELLVVLSIVGLALCMFAPASEETVATYTLDIIIGVVAVGAVAGAFWRRPLLVAKGVL